MYKHILIPTDGSETAEKAVEAGIEFAREADAKITWFTVISEYQHRELSREAAETTLAEPARRAHAAGIACEIDYARSNHPYAAIIAAAKRHDCDLILMSSHGRKGLPALLFGSQTRDVLTHSTIPMLVYR